MSTWMHETRCHGTPQDVLALLTEAEAIARWSPVPFELVDAESGRLRAGDRVRVRGVLGGRSVEFVVQVGDARAGRLSLTASGPIDIDVKYVARASHDGSDVRAQIAVAGRGVRGRLLASATDALLAAGALRASMARIARELDPAFGLTLRTSAIARPVRPRRGGPPAGRSSTAPALPVYSQRQLWRRPSRGLSDRRCMTPWRTRRAGRRPGAVSRGDADRLRQAHRRRELRIACGGPRTPR